MKLVKSLILGLFAASLSAVTVAKEDVTNLWYSEKGLAGKQVFHKTGENSYEGLLEVGWNNRRYKVEERLSTDDDDYLVAYKASGTTAFGSKIEETFEWTGSLARWNSTKDEGEILGTQKRFYVPADGSASFNMMVRALLAAPDKSIDLLPSGKAHISKLRTVTVKNGKQSQQVHLYAISGLDFTPSLSWHDDDGMFFAKDYSGFMRVIRDGYSLDNFKQLADIQTQAESEYLEKVAQQYSHATPRLLVKSVTVADVENKQQLKGVDVLVEQGVITELGKNLKVSGSYKTVSGKGKTLIPGLWDMHGHLSKNDGLLNIAAGVTSVRDIGNNHDNIMSLDKLFSNGGLIGPAVYRAGFMDQESEYSAGLSVKSLAEALEKVNWFADNGYLQVKLYSSIDPSWVKPISDTAHNRGMRVSGHIPAFMTAEQAVENGYDEIQHINMLFLNFLAGTEVDTRQRLRFSLVGEKAHSLDLKSPEVSAFIALLKRKHIVVDPTVSTFRSLLVRENKKIDAEFLPVAEHLPPAVVRSLKGAEMPVPADQWDDYQASSAAMLKMVKLLYDNGVGIVPGTDNIAGFTLQRELELYVQAGIPSIDVLRIASLECARLVGAAHKTGSITVGKQADMLLIDGDPLKNIADIRKVALVIKGEQMFKPSELYGVLGVKPFTSSPTL
ncbi:hypothetical protein R50072_10690 [Simiduia litorea]|uniref:amidohydrolase family protein n=1 Tax=Simiduia litorea TaxID=1435348 RepID=UPI0036F2F394